MKKGYGGGFGWWHYKTTLALRTDGEIVAFQTNEGRESPNYGSARGIHAASDDALLYPDVVRWEDHDSIEEAVARTIIDRFRTPVEYAEPRGAGMTQALENLRSRSQPPQRLGPTPTPTPTQPPKRFPADLWRMRPAASRKPQGTSRTKLTFGRCSASNRESARRTLGPPTICSAVNGTTTHRLRKPCWVVPVVAGPVARGRSACSRREIRAGADCAGQAYRPVTPGSRVRVSSLPQLSRKYLLPVETVSTAGFFLIPHTSRTGIAARRLAVAANPRNVITGR